VRRTEPDAANGPNRYPVAPVREGETKREPFRPWLTLEDAFSAGLPDNGAENG